MPVINPNQAVTSLDSFSKVAEQSQNESKRIQLRGGEVSLAGAWSKNNPAANRQAIEAFSKALQAQYGDAIFSMASIRGILEEHKTAGKGLTGRMVMDMLKLAGEEFGRVNAYNASMVEQFLSGKDAQGNVQNNNLERSIDEFCMQNAIPPGNKADVQSRVQAFLQGKAAQNGFFPTILNLDSLMERVGNGREDCAGPALSLALVLGKEGRHFPGTVADKLRLVDLGVPAKDNALPRALWELAAMRAIQPQGELTRETVWEALFNGAGLPQEILSGGKTFAAALQEKHAADMSAMIKGLGHTDASFTENAFKFMPWSTLAAMRQSGGKTVLTLENMPGAGALLPKGGEDIQKSLNTRLPHAGGEGTKPPEISFTFPGGRKDTIQIGPDTKFGFISEQDKKNYLGGQDNSLLGRLHSNCTALAGGSGKQMAGALFCMTQAPLTLLKEVARLNGAVLDDRLPVNINLRLGPGGVRAEFSSTQGAEIETGRFRMIIDVDQAGTLALRSLEFTPPGILYDQEVRARYARTCDAQEKYTSLLSLDDSKDGLLAAVRQRAESLGLKVNITQNSLTSLRHKTAVRMEAEAARSDANLTLEQIRAMRSDAVDGFFKNVQTLASHVPQEKRDLFVRACLETGALPKPDFLPAIINMTGPVRGTFDALQTARSGHEARRLMADLQAFMLEATLNNKEFAGKGFGTDDFTPPPDPGY